MPILPIFLYQYPTQTGVNLVVLLFFTQFLRNVTFNMQQSIGIHTGAVIKPKTMEMTMMVILTSWHMQNPF